MNAGNVNRENVNRNNINRADTSVHRSDVNSVRNSGNVYVNRDVNVHGGYYGGYHGGYHYDSWGAPLAAAAALTTTALVVGTMVATLPTTGCSTVMAGGVAYQKCGATYYQPVYEGTNVQYVVTNPP